MAEPAFLEGKVEMEAILRREAWGCLGVCAPDGRPYVVPVNYAYVDGKVLFHCALQGRKLDCIRANPSVCFTVARQPGAVREHPGGNPCHVDSESVICYGEARIVEDLKERAEVLNRFNHAFRPAAAELGAEAAAGCAAVEITVREMTGRRERERQRTMWRYAPQAADR
jgi:nitroimidazol reductase NimA-like FMN-containing flavoprotein (pyridoxamine 5'-phosphate oxidase superfamily)